MQVMWTKMCRACAIFPCNRLRCHYPHAQQSQRPGLNYPHPPSLPPFTPPSQRFVLRCSGFAQPSAAFRLGRRGNSRHAGEVTESPCVFAFLFVSHRLKQTKRGFTRCIRQHDTNRHRRSAPPEIDEIRRAGNTSKCNFC